MKHSDAALPSLRMALAEAWEILPSDERKKACVVLLYIFFGTVLEILGIGLVIPAAALLSEPDISKSPYFLQVIHLHIGAPSHLTFTLGALSLMLTVFLVKNIFLGFSIFKQNKFLYELQSNLAGELVSGYYKRDDEYHIKHAAAELLQKVNGELSAFVQNVLGSGLWIVSESVVAVGILIIAIYINPASALVIAIGLGLGGWVYYQIIKKRIEEYGKATQEHSRRMYQEMQKGLGGIKEVKIFGGETYFSRAFRDQAHCLAENMSSYNFFSQVSRQAIEMIVITVLMGATMLLVWKGVQLQAILPLLAFFCLAGFRLMPSAQRLISSAHSVRYGARALPALLPDFKELRQAREYITEERGQIDFKESLKIKNIEYTYPGTSQTVLSNLSIEIPYGKVVGIKGESGSGKTTLVNIITGLLKPARGHIFSDGEDIFMNIAGWQKKIGYVPQDVFLTQDTLRRNVAFGREDHMIDDNKVREALRMAQLNKFLQGRDEGLNAELGERGVLLSGGERQRIGIARALYRQPKILILDEATASLDSETEAAFIETTKHLKGKTTLIIVSHSSSTLVHSDLIYELLNKKLNKQNNNENSKF